MHKEIIEFVTANKGRFTYRELAERFKISHNSVHGIIGRANLRSFIVKEHGGGFFKKGEVKMVKKTKQEISAEARLESLLRAKTNQHKETDQKYKMLQSDLERTQRALASALEVMGHKPAISKIVAKKHTKSESTAVALLSDCHIEELVPSTKVNGLNEHTPDIAKRRIERFFELVIRFIRIERAESDVNTLLLWLGGDLFTSDSHGTPTAMPPMIAAMFAQDLIASGLTYIREQEPNLKIIVVGSVGNHSRKDMMKPVNQALEQELSLEWMVYHWLKSKFENDKVSFILENSYSTYVTVYNKVIRFNHGHLGWRYNDGLGGVHGPLWKVISQKWDKQIKADVTCCGHYHTYTPSALARGYIVNGSTIGATPYSLNFGYEPPAQAFFFVHSKYGIVGQKPLLVDT